MQLGRAQCGCRMTLPCRLCAGTVRDAGSEGEGGCIPAGSAGAHTVQIPHLCRPAAGALSAALQCCLPVPCMQSVPLPSPASCTGVCTYCVQVQERAAQATSQADAMQQQYEAAWAGAEDSHRTGRRLLDALTKVSKRNPVTSVSSIAALQSWCSSLAR